jgi:hypothetical protein
MLLSEYREQQVKRYMEDQHKSEKELLEELQIARMTIAQLKGRKSECDTASMDYFTFRRWIDAKIQSADQRSMSHMRAMIEAYNRAKQNRT